MSVASFCDVLVLLLFGVFSFLPLSVPQAFRVVEWWFLFLLRDPCMLRACRGESVEWIPTMCGS